jgi:hypothetical protein
VLWRFAFLTAGVCLLLLTQRCWRFQLGSLSLDLKGLQEFNLPCAAWRPGFPFVFAGDSTEDNDMPVPNA